MFDLIYEVKDIAAGRTEMISDDTLSGFLDLRCDSPWFLTAQEPPVDEPGDTFRSVLGDFPKQAWPRRFDSRGIEFSKLALYAFFNSRLWAVAVTRLGIRVMGIDQAGLHLVHVLQPEQDILTNFRRKHCEFNAVARPRACSVSA